MIFTCYILYSKNRDRYYVGSTSVDIQDRLRRHNSNHKGFTGGKADWKVVWSEEFKTKEKALAREKQIKKWKSRKMIEKQVQSIPT